MSDYAIKQRRRRSLSRIRELLKGSQYRVVILPHDPVFDVEASRNSEIRKIRIALDEITPEDKKAVESVRIPDPPECVKEIWVQKYGEKGFEVEEVL